MTRTHDEVYLKENRHKDAKESFKFCRSLIPDHNPGARIYDFGCAAGEFPYFLVESFPHDKIIGVELLPELVAKARQEVPGAEFVVGSVEDKSALPADVADFSLMVGVHSIFDDPTIGFGNMINWTRPGGTVIILGIFNSYPVDVFVRVRTQDQPAGHREPGWNMISQASVAKFLSSNPKVAGFAFHPFKIGIDLPKQADPLRAWTEKLENGSRQIVNGIGLVHDYHALVIKLK